MNGTSSSFTLQKIEARPTGGGGSVRNRLVNSALESQIVRIAAERLSDEEQQKQPLSEQKLFFFTRHVHVVVGGEHYLVNIRSAAKRLGISKERVFEAAKAGRFEELLEQESGLRFKQAVPRVRIDLLLQAKEKLVEKARQEGHPILFQQEFIVFPDGLIKYRIDASHFYYFNGQEAGQLQTDGTAERALAALGKDSRFSTERLLDGFVERHLAQTVFGPIEIREITQRILGVVAKLNRLGMRHPSLAEQLYVDSKSGDVVINNIQTLFSDPSCAQENFKQVVRVLEMLYAKGASPQEKALLQGLKQGQIDAIEKYYTSLPETLLCKMMKEALGKAYNENEAKELEGYVRKYRAAYQEQARGKTNQIVYVAYKHFHKSLQFHADGTVILYTKTSLGEGMYKNVRVAIDMDTGEPLAAGFLRKEWREDLRVREELQREGKFYRLVRGAPHFAEMIEIVELESKTEKSGRLICIFKRYPFNLYQVVKLFTASQTRARLARELLEALVHLQTLGIVHRDLKPENILLDIKGHVKIADFGGACDKEHPATVILGTEIYFAPEYLCLYGKKGAFGADELLAATTSKLDIWALGAILYDVRYQGERPAEWPIVEHPITLALDINDEGRPRCIPKPTSSSIEQDPLAHLIYECLQVDPARRPTAKQLLEKYGRYLNPIQ